MYRWQPTKLVYDKYVLTFHQHLNVSIELTKDSGIFIANEEALEVDAEGSSIDDTKRAFAERLIKIYIDIVPEKDGNLMFDALQLKKKLVVITQSFQYDGKNYEKI